MNEIWTSNTYRYLIKENTIGILGDSISLRCSPTSGDSWPTDGAASPALPETMGKNNYSYFGYFHWMNAYLGQVFRPVIYAGISGDTLAKMDARVGTDIIIFNPRYCIIQSSCNGLANELTAEAEFSSLVSICNKLISAQIVPIVSMPGPNTNLNTTAKINQYIKLCNLFSEYGRTGKIILIDLFRNMVDYTADTPKMLSIYSADGVHPKVSGASFMGYNGYTDLKYLFNPVSVFPPYNGGYQTGVLNSLMLTNLGTGTVNGTGVTGTSPDSTAITGTTNGTSLATCTAGLTRTDNQAGKDLGIVFSGTTNGGGEIFQFQTSTVANSVSGFVAGDVVQAYVEFIITTTLVNVKLPIIRWYWNSNLTTTKQLITAVQTLTTDGLRMIFVTPQVTLGAEIASNTVTLLMECFADTAGGCSGELRIGKICIRKIN